MAATTAIPIEVFLQSDEYEPAADYVDGSVEERPTGERDHSLRQAAIQKWFWKHEDEWKVYVCPELRIQTGPARFRVADVAILDRDAPKTQITTCPPLAVFEVLNPEDRVQRQARKLGDYAAMGIREIWVIDPEAGTFSRFEHGQLVRRDRLTVSDRGIDFQVSEIARLLS